MLDGQEAVCPTCLGILQSLEGEGSAGVVGGTGAGGGGGGEDRGQPAIADRDGPSDRGNEGAEKCLDLGAAVAAGQKDELVGEEKLGPGSNLCSLIKAGVQVSGQQSEDLALEVAMPPLVQVRQHALW